MGALVRIYKYFNLLSVDIAIGAIAGASFFASLLEVAVRPYAYMSLGITVWIIYTTDHLFDARKIKAIASTERHRFHQRNFNVLSVLVGLAIAVDLVLIFFIRKPVLYGGFLIASVVGLYLIVHRQLAFLKEAVVALLYSAGILLPSISVTSIHLSPAHYILFVLFFTTALINLLMFSWFDLNNDLADKTQSFVTMVGGRKSLSVLWMIFLLNAVLGAYILYVQQHFNHTMIIITMNATLLLILVLRKWFVSHDRYRLLGDAVFLFPFVEIWLA
jgi:hypothetical protein